MSLNKLSLAVTVTFNFDNYRIVTSWLGTGKSLTFFYSVGSSRNKVRVDETDILDPNSDSQRENTPNFRQALYLQDLKGQ